jgi:hypothetical protein
MSALLCIDPGPVTSGLVELDTTRFPPRIVRGVAKCPNADVLAAIWEHSADVVIERFACMGMAVGEETLEAVHWGGRFHQEADAWHYPVHRIKRHEVKMALCGNTRAKDANIRQAIIDIYGGLTATKKGGALHGVSADAWAALAVGLTYLKQQEDGHA